MSSIVEYVILGNLNLSSQTTITLLGSEYTNSDSLWSENMVSCWHTVRLCTLSYLPRQHSPLLMTQCKTAYELPSQTAFSTMHKQIATTNKQTHTSHKDSTTAKTKGTGRLSFKVTNIHPAYLGGRGWVRESSELWRETRTAQKPKEWNELA